jgi:hypothetical protein
VSEVQALMARIAAARPETSPAPLIPPAVAQPRPAAPPAAAETETTATEDTRMGSADAGGSMSRVDSNVRSPDAEDRVDMTPDPGLLDWAAGGAYMLRCWPVPGHGEQILSLFVVAPIVECDGRASLSVPARWTGNAEFAAGARRRARVRIAACEKASKLEAPLAASTPPEIDAVDASGAVTGDALELAYDRGARPVVRDDIDWAQTPGVASARFFTWERAEFCWKAALALRRGVAESLAAGKAKIPTKNLSLIVVESWTAREAMKR